ncbi:MAG TPA: CidA/LrgA family protein [Terriglobales bacterium]|nr:CidA/LrgA family protein [Terriglobales bacterium]
MSFGPIRAAETTSFPGWSRVAARLAGWAGSWAKAGLLIGLWAGCDWLSRHFALPLPSGILGLVLLLAALACGLIRSDWLRPGTGRLMGHMLLFFIPAMMAPLAHRELFGLLGLKVMAIIVISTTTVMLSTGLIVEACFRRRPAVATPPHQPGTPAVIAAGSQSHAS